MNGNNQQAGSPPAAGRRQADRSQWRYLKDMPLPPDMQQEVERLCKTQRCRKPADRLRVEEEVKFRFFFGGRDVLFMETPKGNLILHVGDYESPEFHQEWGAVRNALPLQEHCMVEMYSPRKWNEPEPVRKEPDRSKWRYLKDMPLPPDMQQEVERSLRKKGWRTRDDRRHVEECLKLQHFFGGQWVAFKVTPQGLLILYAGDYSNPEFDEVLNSLPPEERCQVTLYTPSKWNDTETTIPSGFLNDEMEEPSR
jgi:hypothetical protein